MLLASKAGGYMDNAVLAVDGGRNMVCGCLFYKPRHQARNWQEGADGQVAGINDGVPLPDEAY